MSRWRNAVSFELAGRKRSSKPSSRRGCRFGIIEVSCMDSRICWSRSTLELLQICQLLDVQLVGDEQLWVVDIIPEDQEIV